MIWFRVVCGLCASTMAVLANVELRTPSTYFSELPFPVRVEIRKADGTVDRDFWTGEVLLETDWPNPNEDAKGISVFHGAVTVRRTLIANCFVGISAKSSGPLADVRMDRCTIISRDKGVSAAFKSNATAGQIAIQVSNSIVRAPDALHSDFGNEKITARYSSLSEAWPGPGNLAADPLFIDPATGNYQLQKNSPCIDAGDPEAGLDPDGSRIEMGVFPVVKSVWSNPPKMVAVNPVIFSEIMYHPVSENVAEEIPCSQPISLHSSWTSAIFQLSPPRPTRSVSPPASWTKRPLRLACRFFIGSIKCRPLRSLPFP